MLFPQSRLSYLTTYLAPSLGGPRDKNRQDTSELLYLFSGVCFSRS
jgi:hypothetical protein